MAPNGHTLNKQYNDLIIYEAVLALLSKKGNATYLRKNKFVDFIISYF